MKHTAYALEAILQNELKSIIAEEYKERGCSSIETHAYTQGYLCAVRRMKEMLLKQKGKEAYFDYIVYDERKPYAFIKYFLKKGWKGLKPPEQVNQELLQ